MKFIAINENIIVNKISNYEDPNLQKSSIIVIPDIAKNNDFFIAEVVSVGNLLSPLAEGDRVIVSNGVGIKLNDSVFMIKESDVFAKVVENS